MVTDLGPTTFNSPVFRPEITLSAQNLPKDSCEESIKQTHIYLLLLFSSGTTPRHRSSEVRPIRRCPPSVLLVSNAPDSFQLRIVEILKLASLDASPIVSSSLCAFGERRMGLDIGNLIRSRWLAVGSW